MAADANVDSSDKEEESGGNEGAHSNNMCILSDLIVNGSIAVTSWSASVNI